MKKQYLLLFLLICTAIYQATAQDLTPLPHYPTPEEQVRTKAYLDSVTSSISVLSPTPPPAPVRTMAEWEEVQAVLITWVPFYDDILGEIVRHSVEECEVVIFTDSPSTVTSYLNSQNIPMENVSLVFTEYDSIWIRDYGPWAVYHNDVDSLMLVDWIYNRPRPNDDVIPTVAANHFGLPIYEAIQAPNDWVHTGGNNLRDGMGTNFSSNLIFEENPDKTEAEIDEIANLFLGVQRYIKFETLPFDAIHHLDMHMRFIDEETVIVGEYPPGVADGPQINQNLEYLVNDVPTAFGNQYNVIRMLMPPAANGFYPPQGHYRTYTNSLFVNKTVLVPIYEEAYDTIALRIYQEALPGYNIVGIDCNQIIPAFGALHCITKLVGTNDPLWIAHPKLRDTEETEEDYPVMAIIKHRSGIENASLHYRLRGEDTYAAIPMTLTDPADDIWTASLPAQSPGSVVEYYIHARANSGKEQVRPLVAPQGFFNFKVLGDPVGIDFEPVPALQGLEFELFPNPVTDVINLEFVAEQSTTVNIWLSNALGQRAQLMTQQLPYGQSSLRIPVASLSRGTYEISIEKGAQIGTKKVMVVK
jgi:agmatine/peptidylarginine deiminase